MNARGAGASPAPKIPLRQWLVMPKLETPGVSISVLPVTLEVLRGLRTATGYQDHAQDCLVSVPSDVRGMQRIRMF